MPNIYVLCLTYLALVNRLGQELFRAEQKCMTTIKGWNTQIGVEIRSCLEMSPY